MAIAAAYAEQRQEYYLFVAGTREEAKARARGGKVEKMFPKAAGNTDGGDVDALG